MPKKGPNPSPKKGVKVISHLQQAKGDYPYKSYREDGRKAHERLGKKKSPNLSKYEEFLLNTYFPSLQTRHHRAEEKQAEKSKKQRSQSRRQSIRKVGLITPPSSPDNDEAVGGKVHVVFVYSHVEIVKIYILLCDTEIFLICPQKRRATETEGDDAEDVDVFRRGGGKVHVCFHLWFTSYFVI